MYNQENYVPSSPQKRSMNYSPVASPLKQPRKGVYIDHENGYKPVTKDQIIGKPIEIIQGKLSKLKFTLTS